MTLRLVQPRKESETQLHVSHSQLLTYTMCPMKYAHTYVWDTPTETKPVSLIFGKAVHKAAERYYRCLQEAGEVLAAEEVIGVFQNVFDHEVKSTEVEISLKDGDTIESVRKQGSALLEIFHTEIRPQKIVAVEMPFAITVPDINNGGDLPVNLVGYLDLVESDDEGNYLICELKTAAVRYSSIKLAYDLQPTVYSYAMNRMNLASTERSCLVRYDVLLKTRKPAFESYFVSRTRDDYERLVQLINSVLKAIENRIFYRIQGWPCQDCQFRKTCLS